MTWHFVCNYSDLIASAAPIAYQAVVAYVLDQVKNPPISILYHTGRSDTFASISSARSARDQVVSGLNMNLSNKDENANYLWEYYSNSNGLDFQFVEHSYSTSPLLELATVFQDQSIHQTVIPVRNKLITVGEKK